MSRKRFRPEEIVNKLREADVLIAKGHTVAREHASAVSFRNARIDLHPIVKIELI